MLFIIHVPPLLLLLLLLLPSASSLPLPLPLVLNTWPWPNATLNAFQVLLLSKGDVVPDASQAVHLDAVLAGTATCERMQCDGSVGFGGSPDENGETTLDAMIMDGNTMDVGAVGNLRFIKDAAQTARFVLEHTSHTLLAGNQATQFAVDMGLATTDLTTAQSEEIYQSWRNSNCQPNYRENVTPNAKTSCGPYKPNANIRENIQKQGSSRHNHDTIAMVAIDAKGNVAAGTSTNGASHKVPGRIGDAPIAGAGAYADSEVGGCGATGDGDQMMRLLPCFYAVQLMRQGASPKQAAEAAVDRIAKYYPSFWGGIVVVNVAGEHAGAANVGTPFSYTVVSDATGGQPQIVTVTSHRSKLLSSVQNLKKDDA